jgi:signal transduction histidine kinase
MMRRLFWQIYFTVLAVVVMFALTLPVAWWLLPERQEHLRAFEGVAALVVEHLPPIDEPDALQPAIESMSRTLGMDVSVRDARGVRLAAVSTVPEVIDPDQLSGHWVRQGRRGAATLHLPDGRWLLVTPPGRPAHHAGFLVSVAILCSLAAIGALPVVRRITRRLEKLQRQVDGLGGGDFSTRVEVEGNDEVAELARSFNRAADRIERLVSAQRNTLASASHELRSPLARMRVAIELLARGERQELRERVTHDINELDDLIDELLLASRLDAAEDLGNRESVDLLALLAEEAARSGAHAHGDAVRLDGDPRMLRRMLRNLLENARRHGDAHSIDASIRQIAPDRVQIRVSDGGAGVAAEERERIFEPFYRPPGMREGDGGVGLGLALVRRIARHHGGDAQCLPSDDAGSCFEVTLATR